MKVMQLRTVRSDGTVFDGDPFEYFPIDPDTGQPYAGDNPEDPPPVVITVQPISRARELEIRERCTDHVIVKGVGVQEKVDEDKVFDEVVKYVIRGWRGVIAADGKALPCVDAAKVALDYPLKLDILRRARRSESVEVSEASFREPA